MKLSKKDIEDPTTFLDNLVDEYVDLLTEQTKALITLEAKERYEDCQNIINYLDEVTYNVGQTISTLSGVDKDLTMKRLRDSRQKIYDELKKTFGE